MLGFRGFMAVGALVAVGVMSAARTGSTSDGIPARAMATDACGRALVGEQGERLIHHPDRPCPEPSGPKAATGSRAEGQAVAAGDDPDLLTLEWRRGTFGTGIGVAGLEVADIDRDGSPEIVASASPGGFGQNRFWYVLRKTTLGYEQSWVSAPEPYTVTDLIVAQVDGDPALEVLVATGSRIRIYDGATKALEREIQTTASEVRGLTLADLDGDGTPEIAFCDANALFIYDLASGLQESSLAGYGGRDLAVGNVDADAGLEIVIGNDASTGYVLDGASRAMEWANPWGFGTRVRLGDLDGDGRLEVVAGYPWYSIKVFDVDLQSLTASIATSHDIGALRVTDVEGDGPLEIVYGDGQWGGIHVLNGQSRVQKWMVTNPEHGVTEIVVADTEGSNLKEVLWGAGHTSTGPDHLYVADSVSRLQNWASPDFVGPFRALSFGDVDDDGHTEILSGSFQSDSGYADGLYFIHDGRTKALEYQSGLLTTRDWMGLERIQRANVDGDPQDEIFVTTSDLYNGVIVSYDGLTHAAEWPQAIQIESGLAFVSMQVADVDRDGSLELVAGVRQEHTGATGGYVFLFDAATGALEWQSPSLPSGYWYDLALLRIANVDTDPALEILVGNYGSELFVVDGVTHVVNHLGLHHVTALETPDRDGDGVAEIVIGTEEGGLQVLSPATGAVVQPIGNYGARIDGLAVRDLDGDCLPEYVFALRDEVFVYSSSNPTARWRSGVIGPGDYTAGVGARDSLIVGDVDDDGRLEVVVNVGAIGFNVYETGPIPVHACLGTAPSTTVTFGSVSVGGSADRAVTLFNRGNGMLLGSASVTGPAFSLVSSGSFAIPPGGSTTLTTRFTPMAAGGAVGTMTLTGGGGKSLVLSATGVAPSVTIQGTSVVPPLSSVPVQVTNGPANTTDWLGLYATGTPNADLLDWKYLNGSRTAPGTGLAAASVAFWMPATPGTYEVRLFAKNSYWRLQTSAVITVQPSTPSVNVVGSTTVTAGGAVVVQVTNGPGNAADWVGMHATGAPDTALTDWKYLNGTRALPGSGVSSAQVTFAAPANPGTYEFRFFRGGGYARLATSQMLTVQAATNNATVTVVGPTTVSPRAVVPAQISGGPANRTDWVGLYSTSAPDSAVLDWKYLNGSRTPPTTGVSDATVSLEVPASAGTYEFRLFRSNTYTRLATSLPVTVVASSGSPSLTVVGATTVTSGTVVQVVVADGPGSATDWVGLHVAGAADVAYADWKYLNGTRMPPPAGLTSATLSFPMPLTPGTYNFRLFASNTVTKLATSVTLTVQ